MLQVDAASIVPSTRDLLQVLATKRRSMALVGVIGPESPAEEAARLHDLNVSALAAVEPGVAMQLAARATKTVPTLLLLAAGDRDAFLAARYYGADGVCVDASLPLDEWDKLAKNARMTRMLPLALAADEASVDAAIKSGARAILVRAASSEAAIALAAKAPRTITVVAEIAGADADALRALRGHVDAAVVPPSVHQAQGFAALVAELDP
jgi:indole-3-glycerol phosphate synthase